MPLSQSQSIDGLMEDASEALARMAYLRCEAKCLEALALARRAGDWRYYARILMPLQEARRQRRMTAADGVLRLGTSDASDGAAWTDRWLATHRAGCAALSEPLDRSAAQAMRDRCRAEQRYVEVLFITQRTPAAWTVSDVTGRLRCERPAPPEAWRDRDVPPQTPEHAAGARDWFLDAMEALGDAGLREAGMAADLSARMQKLEQAIEAAGDHELLHQALGQVVHQLEKGDGSPA